MNSFVQSFHVWLMLLAMDPQKEPFTIGLAWEILSGNFWQELNAVRRSQVK